MHHKIQGTVLSIFERLQNTVTVNTDGKIQSHLMIYIDLCITKVLFKSSLT